MQSQSWSWDVWCQRVSLTTIPPKTQECEVTRWGFAWGEGKPKAVKSLFSPPTPLPIPRLYSSQEENRKEMPHKGFACSKSRVHLRFFKCLDATPCSLSILSHDIFTLITETLRNAEQPLWHFYSWGLLILPKFRIQREWTQLPGS